MGEVLPFPDRRPPEPRRFSAHEALPPPREAILPLAILTVLSRRIGANQLPSLMHDVMDVITDVGGHTGEAGLACDQVASLWSHLSDETWPAGPVA